MNALLHRHARRLVALALVTALYLLARLPDLPAGERAALAARFRFERAPLPEVPGPPLRTVRAVHPDLQRISAWISSVGAAAALNDLDGDGLPNDVCYVEVRTDQVIVAPVPGARQRYPPFALNPAPLTYDATMAPMGCLPGDINEDGRMDLVVYYWGRSPIAFVKQPDGAYKPGEIDPRGERWFTNAAAFADLDGDGHSDLIVGNYFPDGARILDPHASSAASMQHSMSRAFNSGRKHIFLWTPAGFREAVGALPAEAVHGWTLALGAADLDGDLLPELYFGSDFGPDRLFHNRSTPGHLSFALARGVKTFTAPSSKVLGHDSFKGMGIDFADINGDGWPDIYISNIAAEYALEESHFLWASTGRPELLKSGIAPYADRSEPLGLSRSGWGWDCRLADFDNDGVAEAVQAVGFVRGEHNRWPELHEMAMGNDQLLSKPAMWHRVQPGDDLSGHQHNPFFVRAASGRFFDIAAELGMGEDHVSRAVAIADVDGDGLLDYAVGNQWEPSLYFHNRSPRPGKFLGLRLRYPSGAPAIGAAAIAELTDGRKLTAQADGGSGHSGKRSPEIHFGMGTAEAAAVRVRWRDAAGIHEKTLPFRSGWHNVVLEAGR